uniref:Uncharacterized protein n=1 Tax=Janibacter limosus TaxID=53458 RepID=A0AC61U179_9MICO|nr:hypothetical protein [Janibacter limosus]
MGSVTTPRLITADDLSLRPPLDDDTQLVAELMGVPITAERPAQIVRMWREHWDEHGYGTWIITDAAGRRLRVRRPADTSRLHPRHDPRHRG